MTVSSAIPDRPWNGQDTAKPFSVSEWGSNPDETDNDDCWRGSDHASRAEAEAEMARLLASTRLDTSTAYVMLDGPDVHTVAPVPAYHTPKARRAREREERSDRSEHAMQMGMAFGCDGYNDAMGY